MPDSQDLTEIATIEDGTQEPSGFAAIPIVVATIVFLAKIGVILKAIGGVLAAIAAGAAAMFSYGRVAGNVERGAEAVGRGAAAAGAVRSATAEARAGSSLAKAEQGVINSERVATGTTTATRSRLALRPSNTTAGDELTVAIERVESGSVGGINYDLISGGKNLSLVETETIVSTNLTMSAYRLASKPNSNVTFEVLTGKMTVTANRTVKGVKVTGGEVNLYKMAAASAVGIYACQKLKSPELGRCVDRALRKSTEAVRKAT